MEKTCLFCGNIAEEQYRVNEIGDVFCDDDCYERYYESRDCGDATHPYIDDYEAIRRIYLDWLANWEYELNEDPEFCNLQYRADEILDKIDEVYDAYWDFYNSEGDDGVFAREIYLYLLKFQELQREILCWRPQEREVFFYLYLETNINGSHDNWEAFAKYLHQIGASDICELLKAHLHPYDSMAFYFETKEELDEVAAKLAQRFGDEIELYINDACRCEGQCADIEVIANVGYQDGWFFCDSCESSYYPGFFSKEALQQEIQLIDERLETEQPLGKSNWHFYIRKIKRSCRYHEIDYPEWIDLDYYF